MYDLHEFSVITNVVFSFVRMGSKNQENSIAGILVLNAPSQWRQIDPFVW
jgi:hypothetical protein